MIGAIFAALMAGSFFMPWVELFGEGLGPAMLFDENGPPLGDIPLRGWAFLASFVIAALAALAALMGRAAGVLMLLAGAIPYTLIAEQAFFAKEQLDDLGLPFPRMDDPQQVFEMLREVVAMGMPAYFVSAAILIVVGLGRGMRGV